MLDPAVKKRLDRERELEADLANAADLLQGTSIGELGGVFIPSTV